MWWTCQKKLSVCCASTRGSKRSILGSALNRWSVLGQFEKWCKAANLKRITIHGLRHTCATLLLSAGVAAHVVQRRLGHKSISITLDTYGHVLPAMQQEAAKRLAELLHG